MTPHAKREERLSNLLRWAKEIPEPLRTLHRDHGVHVHLRPTSSGVTPHDLGSGAASTRQPSIADLQDLVARFDTVLTKHCGPRTPLDFALESTMQTVLIKDAYENSRNMVMLGDATRGTNDEVALIFVADELSMPTGIGRGEKKFDVFALRPFGDSYRAVIIELKIERSMKSTIEQVGGYGSILEAHMLGFESLATALLERDVRLEAKCERWIVWPELNPSPDEPQVSVFAEHGIRVITYARAGSEFTFRAYDAP